MSFFQQDQGSAKNSVEGPEAPQADMDTLPQEMRRVIAFYVSQPLEEPKYALCHQLRTKTPESEVSDLKNLRLVNHGFAAAAAPCLYSEVLVILNTASFDRLRKITEHPVYHKYVRALRYEPNVAYRTPETGRLVGSSSKGLAICDKTKDRFRAPKNIAKKYHLGKHLVHSPGTERACSGPYDTCELARAVKKLPNLEQQIFNKARKDAKGWEFPETRELEILLWGVHAAGIRLKRFVSYLVDFDMLVGGQNAPMIEAVFRDIQDLDIEAFSPRDCNLVPSKLRCMAELLSGRENLRSITLYDEGPDPQLSLPSLLGGCHWPLLQEVTLHFVNTTEESLVGLFAKHASTLRKLSLGMVRLEEG